MSSAVQAEVLLTPQQEEQLYGDYIIKPSDVNAVWDHANPRSYVSEKLRKFIDREVEIYKKDNGGQNFNYYDGENNYYEQPEMNWIADYFINNLVFCKNEILISDSQKISKILNFLWSLLDWRNKDEYQGDTNYAWTVKYQFITQELQRLFQEKVLNKVQVKQVLEYTRKTYFRHFHLYNFCIKNKQLQFPKEIKLYKPMPQVATGGLAPSVCQEQIDEKNDQDQLKSQADKDGEGQKEFVEPEDIIDPDDPLYGLEQRLRNLELDEESRRIIVDKLQEASTKIKTSLEDRQKNLDQKIAGDKPGAKKK